MFASAKKVARAPAPTKAATGASRPTDLIPGWQDLCALDACVKALEGLIALKKAAVTAAAIDRLMARGLARKSRPDSLKLEEGDAAGNASIRRRDVRRPVTPDEAELIADLTGEGVEVDGLNTSPGFTEVLEAQPDYYTFNPEWLPGGQQYDELKFKRLEKLIEKDFPDLIIQVEGERKVVVSETAVDRCFQLAEEKARELFPLIAGVTLKPVHRNLRAAWAYVETLLGEAPAKTPERKGKAA